MIGREPTPLEAVRNRIARAEAHFGRPPGAVTLIAVTKTQGAEAILPLLEAGHRDFGENRVQEAQGKWPALKERFPETRLHLIGPLQTNKVRDAVALFDAIHTLDRPRLADALAAERARAGRPTALFVQVNTGEEPQKAGVLPADADAFLERCRADAMLDVVGLMCIPPAEQPPSAHFAFLARMAGRRGLPQISMGMSADYEAAIQCGATLVRVGSALFGARPPH